MSRFMKIYTEQNIQLQLQLLNESLTEVYTVQEGFGDIAGKIFDALHKALRAVIKIITRIISAIVKRIKELASDEDGKRRYEEMKRRHEEAMDGVVDDLGKAFDDLNNKIDQDIKDINDRRKAFEERRKAAEKRRDEHMTKIIKDKDFNATPNPSSIVYANLNFNYNNLSIDSLRNFYNKVLEILDIAENKVMNLDKSKDITNIQQMSLNGELSKLQTLVDENCGKKYDITWADVSNSIDLHSLLRQVKMINQGLKDKLTTIDKNLEIIERRRSSLFDDFTNKISKQFSRKDVAILLVKDSIRISEGKPIDPNNTLSQGESGIKYNAILNLDILTKTYQNIIKVALRASNLILSDSTVLSR